jgi:predicted dinucleotide-binding enzyme
MHTKQTIAIIGMGQSGKAIAAALSKSNARLLLVDKNVDEAKSIATSLHDKNDYSDIEATECSYNAAWEADIIILAVPCSAQADIAEYIKEVSTQKIVIAVSDSLDEEINSEQIAAAAEELQQLLPYCKVAKAFQLNGKDIDCFLRGNDEEAAQTINELFKTINDNSVVAG